MEITFDPAKREATLSERGLDFVDASLLFAGIHISVPDERMDYGEPRYQTVGYLRDRMVMVVGTPRGTARHVISMRKCNEREKKQVSAATWRKLMPTSSSRGSTTRRRN